MTIDLAAPEAIERDCMRTCNRSSERPRARKARLERIGIQGRNGARKRHIAPGGGLSAHTRNFCTIGKKRLHRRKNVSDVDVTRNKENSQSNVTRRKEHVDQDSE